MSKYIITEPRPSVDAGSYTHSGRGGAGNTFRASTSSSARRPTTQAMPPRSAAQAAPFHSGIGGAGNRHKAGERAAIDLSEDFARAQVRDAKGRAHVGVGGAGNVYRREAKTQPQLSNSKPRRESNDSGSGSSGIWGRLSSSSFTRH